MTHDDSFDDFPSDQDAGHDDPAAHEFAAETPAGPELENEWDEHDPIGKPVKKKKFSDKWLIGGAVAIALVILVVKLGGGNGNHAPPHPVTAAHHAATPATVTAAATPPATPAKPLLKLPPTREDMIYGASAATGDKTMADNTAAPAQTGFLNDPAALKKVEDLQAAHVLATKPAPTPPPVVNKVPAVIVPEVAKAPPVLSPVLTPAAPPVAVTPPPATNAVSNDKLKDIAAQLATITTQLQDLQANAARKSELADLKTQVAALKEQINQPPAMVIQTPSATETPAPVHHHIATVTHKPHPHAAALTASASHWSLKSAQPGIAIVDSGNGRLITVQAGDHLKGLGTVKSIAQQDGQWVVKGTGGQITQ